MPSNITNAQMTRNKPKLPMKIRFCHANTLIASVPDNQECRLQFREFEERTRSVV